MRLLLDTNIFLEVLLGQERSEQSRQFLANPEEHELFIADFSLHFIGLLLFRHRRQDAFRRFLADTLLSGAVERVALSARELEAVVRAAEAYDLAFDDAYQYAAAEHRELDIVSLDTDFDRTDRGRRTPDRIGL